MKGGLRGFDAGALRLLTCGAMAVLLIGLLLFATGATEENETRAWVVAFALALPGGLVLATYQERRLAEAAPAAAARGLAAGLALLALAFLLRRTGTGDEAHHAVLAAAALGALLAPFLAARLWRDPDDSANDIARVVSLVSVAFLLLLFVPRRALEIQYLLPALALAAAAVFVLRLRRPPWLTPPARIAVDVIACVGVVLVVVQLPDLLNYVGNLLIHHLYFLGPANDVVHGRPMLGTAWSQYGTGLIDGLGLFFTVVPIGFGTLALLVTALTALQYLCVYAILRLSGLGIVLTLAAVAVAALGNLFSTLETYVAFPSTSPLRFGIPYVMVLAAVIGARSPRYARGSRIAVVALVALAAAWSFETFAYAVGTYGALVLVEALAAGDGALRRILRGAAVGIAASLAAVAVLSLATLLLSGHLEWGPYVEYLKLYSVQGFFQLPIQFFDAGPLAGAGLFIGAAMLLWLAQSAPATLPPPLRVALAGFTGFAVISFTYYLGRSHWNNLLGLLVPMVAIAALWMQVLLSGKRNWWRTAAVGALALGMAMIAVASWPSIEAKKGSTALGLLVPGNRSLWGAVGTLADNPVLDARTPVGTELLDRYWPQGEPALVLTDPDLTTEILLEADRRNLLPISHPPEDSLIESSAGRVRDAAAAVPAGTLLLTSPVPPPGSYEKEGIPEFAAVELTALDVLRQRFRFVPVERNTSGLEVVRLVPRG